MQHLCFVLKSVKEMNNENCGTRNEKPQIRPQSFIDRGTIQPSRILIMVVKFFKHTK
jgi:hypothetical protein